MNIQMKKTFTAVCSAAVLFGLAGCAGNKAENQSTEAAKTAGPEAAGDTAAPTAETTDTAAASQDGNSMIIYFSATGTTKGVAEKIADATGSEIYEIVPAEPYTSDDLNYSDSSTRATQEQNDPSVRPEIAGELPDLSSYDMIYLGYPIWWGEEPRIMDTFVEAENFEGRTIAPFVTSSSSGIGSSAKNLAELAGNGNWLEGKRFSGSVSDAEIQEWVSSLQ